MKLPPKQICQLCAFGDDHIAVSLTPDGTSWLFACSSPEHPTPHTWSSKIERYTPARDGICEELGLYDDLEQCVTPGAPWVEYGIVEHRYRLRRPDIYFGQLLDRYGHRAKAPKSFTLSALLAKCLGQLTQERVLIGRLGPATGYWRYNGQISYWARRPAPSESESMTWLAFASSTEGLDPETWDLTPPG